MILLLPKACRHRGDLARPADALRDADTGAVARAAACAILMLIGDADEGQPKRRLAQQRRRAL